jgi:hypothetical protein
MHKEVFVTLLSVTMLLFAMPLVQHIEYSVSAQNEKGSITTTENKSANGSSNSPFSGESIKIIAFRSFFKESEWRLIDNLTSSGYEIKSIIPSKNIYIAILEKEN